MVSRAGLVAHDDAISLDMGGTLLEDFVDGEDLSVRGLGLELFAEVVPELRLGNHLVAGEQSDGVHLGAGILLGGRLAAHDEVLPDLSLGQLYLHLQGRVGRILSSLLS